MVLGAFFLTLNINEVGNRSFDKAIGFKAGIKHEWCGQVTQKMKNSHLWGEKSKGAVLKMLCKRAIICVLSVMSHFIAL